MVKYALLGLFLIVGDGYRPIPIRIKAKWDLPLVLKEVSGIAYIDKDRFACIQDEAGTIYIYNVGVGKIEKQVQFTGAGDFEGICLVKSDAWLVRSDGKLFEVKDYQSEHPDVKEYPTRLTMRQNVEGLCYDESNNRLLLAIKDSERGDQTYKGIYSFDLNTKTLAEQPVLRIDLQSTVFREGQQKKGHLFMPSDISIHPSSKDIYITDGSRSRLLIMESSGKIRELITLSAKEFSQPEGICFDPNGHMFISNEGVKNAGNILAIAME